MSGDCDPVRNADGVVTIPWYLLQLKPGGVKRAEVNLRRQGVQVFSPRHRTTTASGVAALKPLFSNYLFAGFKLAEIPFKTINSTFGVSRIVMQGYDLRTGLPPALVNNLKARCDDMDVLCPPDDLRANEPVRILAGPFASYVAIVEKLSTADRVRVLFELMGRQVSAEIAISEVERAVAS